MATFESLINSKALEVNLDPEIENELRARHLSDIQIKYAKAMWHTVLNKEWTLMTRDTLTLCGYQHSDQVLRNYVNQVLIPSYAEGYHYLVFDANKECISLKSMLIKKNWPDEFISSLRNKVPNTNQPRSKFYFVSFECLLSSIARGKAKVGVDLTLTLVTVTLLAGEWMERENLMSIDNLQQECIDLRSKLSIRDSKYEQYQTDIRRLNSCVDEYKEQIVEYERYTEELTTHYQFQIETLKNDISQYIAQVQGNVEVLPKDANKHTFLVVFKYVENGIPLLHIVRRQRETINMARDRIKLVYEVKDNVETMLLIECINAKNMHLKLKEHVEMREAKHSHPKFKMSSTFRINATKLSLDDLILILVYEKARNNPDICFIMDAAGNELMVAS